VRVESLGGLGDGIAMRDGKPVFVPKSCAGDVLEVAINQQTKEFSRGQIVNILEAGADRTKPPCPHFSECGGCSLQQLNEAAYRAFKERVLADALAHAGFGGFPAEVTFLPAATRRRVEFKTLHTKTGLKLAYHGLRSHQLVAVDSCLILEPALQALLTPLTQALSELPFSDSVSGISLTALGKQIDMVLELSAPAPHSQAITALAQRLGITRISIQQGKTLHSVHSPADISITLGKHALPLPARSFLQATDTGQAWLTEFVLTHTKGAKKVADLFCGIGTYSVPLSESASVQAFEIQGEAIATLQAAAKQRSLNLRTQVRDLFQQPLSSDELRAYDVLVLNPPRAGAKAQTEEIAASRVAKVVMISCNPASFARDARTLKNAGFSLMHAAGLDQFVFSPHLEIAAAFSR